MNIKTFRTKLTAYFLLVSLRILLASGAPLIAATPAGQIEPDAGQWQTWVLKTGDELRPTAPPNQAATNLAAYYWQTNIGTYSFYDWAHRHIFEQKWDINPPRAERVYALMSVAKADAGIACFDSKYAHWAIRPSQLDPEDKSLFPPPPHPSYPSAHGCNSGATAAVLAYLFPADGKTIDAQADDAAMSRMWAGIHYRSDDDEGLALGRAVAKLVIERAKQDGSQ